MDTRASRRGSREEHVTADTVYMKMQLFPETTVISPNIPNYHRPCAHILPGQISEY
jgi:hypothetical protein